MSIENFGNFQQNTVDTNKNKNENEEKFIKQAENAIDNVFNSKDNNLEARIDINF